MFAFDPIHDGLGCHATPSEGTLKLQQDWSAGADLLQDRGGRVFTALPGLEGEVRYPQAESERTEGQQIVQRYAVSKQPDGKNCQRHRAAEGERILIGELGRRHLADSITQGKMTSRIRSTFTRPSTSLTIIQPQRVVSNL